MKKHAVITSEFFGRFSDEGEKLLLEEGFNIVSNPYRRVLKEEEIISIVGNADAIICDLEIINQKIIDSAPSLKVIARRGVGIDSVDVNYAKGKNIVVARTPGVVEKPVAELVMSYIIEIYRKVNEMNREMKNGNWTKFVGNSLEGKVLGIVGVGNIGKELVRKAKAFDMDIIYTNLSGSRDIEKEHKIKYVEFNDLLRNSDIISIHTLLTPSTANLFHYEVMKQMKKKPILINTARGPIINEEDLCKALDEKIISYAAIDVFDIEPKTDSPLRNYENVILTPHVGTFTKETFIKMDILAAKNVIKYLANREVRHSN